MIFKIEVTRQFLKDLKLARKRNFDESKLNEVIEILTKGENLPLKNHDHSLSGNYAGYRECHISPNWLLIYKRQEILKIISLVRTGTHSDLF